MKRRELLKAIGLSAGATATGGLTTAVAGVASTAPKKVLRIAHITDVHIRPEYNAVARFRKCLEKLNGEKPDIILNGGDSVYAVDYKGIEKKRVLELWGLWKDSMQLVTGTPVYSVLGNHDMWWDGNGDELYGKPGAIKMLGIPNNYYSFDRNGWHFILLDSNHPTTSGKLDDEQWKWFEDDLKTKSQGKPTLIMTHFPMLSCLGIADHNPDFTGPFQVDGGGAHLDIAKFIGLFNEQKNVKICLSGHVHLLDKVWYNNVTYCCNGAVSGFWWEPGQGGKSFNRQTGPGFSIVDLYEDGSFDSRYLNYES